MGAVLVRAVVAIALGVGGAYALFWLGNALVDRFARKDPDKTRAGVFVAPAMFVGGLFLIFPLVETIRLTVYSNNTVRGEGRPFVGLENYTNVLGDQVFFSSLWNNILWMIFVPSFAVAIGLAAAVVMRIGFALITVQLLALVGLLLAGGLLLLWVCWKMWRELQEQRTHDQAEAEKAGEQGTDGRRLPGGDGR